MAMGRHLGRGKYVSGLAGFAIEDLAVTKAFEVLRPPPLRALPCAFAERLDSLPPSPSSPKRPRRADLLSRDLPREVRRPSTTETCPGRYVRCSDSRANGGELPA